MKFYDQTIQIPSLIIRQLLDEANQTAMRNYGALQRYFLHRDNKSPVLSNFYFNCREKASQAYVDSNAQRPSLEYNAVWAWQIGLGDTTAAKPKYDIVQILNGYCTHLFVYECKCSVLVEKEKPVGHHCSSIHVYGGSNERTNRTTHNRISLNNNGISCPLNPSTFADAVVCINEAKANSDLMADGETYLS